MNRGLYTSATGMVASQQWMDVVSNNLANASTTGFKRDEVTFKESYLQQLRANGGSGASIGSMPSGPQPNGTFTIFDKGSMLMTGNPMDMAINTPEGMFAVQTLNGTRYTRAGSFVLNDQGTLVTPSGLPVLDERGNTIQITAGQFKVTSSGKISANDLAMGSIGVYTGDFRKEGNNLYTVSGVATAKTEPNIVAGAVESSNVNTVETMIEMIQVQRLYEMAQKSVQQHDEATKTLIEGFARG